MNKSETRRLMEQDRPMRLAFNNWYHSSNKAKDLESVSIFGEGFLAAIIERKIDPLKTNIPSDAIIQAFKEWSKPYGKEWKPGIEQCYATGWEYGKKYR